MICSCNYETNKEEKNTPFEATKSKVKLVQFNPSECDSLKDTSNTNNLLTNKHLKGDTLILGIAFTTKCYMHFSPYVEHKNDVLNIYLNDGSTRDGSVIDCLCRFNADILIKGINKLNVKTLLEGSEINLID